jgi:hypothetical protein
MRSLAGLFVLLAGAAQAAEPVPAAAPAKAAPSATPAPAAPERKPLDLRIRDIRNYMTPDEFRALLTGREEERNTVVVQANVPLVPMKSALDVPGGIIAPFWALANPHKAWRLFLPDPRVNIQEIPPAEVKVPPPFRAGVPDF